MAWPIEQLGLDRERLSRRVDFLVHLAREPVGRGDLMGESAAATLLRDAGLTALLAGEGERATRLLARSAGRWLRLGSYYGLLLQRLAGWSRRPYVRPASIRRPDRPPDPTPEDLIRRLLSGQSDARADLGVETSLPLEGDSSRSTRQLLNLFQSVRCRHDQSEYAGLTAEDELSSAEEVALKRLKSAPGLQVGVTGLPVTAYVELFLAVSSDDMADRHRDLILMIGVQRQVAMEAAQSDGYHWRLMQRPADVIDVDLLVLSLAALEAGAQSAVAELSNWWKRGEAAALPFTLASLLYDYGGGRRSGRWRS